MQLKTKIILAICATAMVGYVVSRPFSFKDYYFFKTNGFCKNCNLAGISIHNENFKGADFSGTSFKNAEFRNVVLEDVNLKGVDFTGADFSGVEMTSSSPSADKLNKGIFRNIKGKLNRFTNIKFNACDFSGSNFQFDKFNTVIFQNSTFNSATFDDTHFQKVKFLESEAQGVSIDKSNIEDSQFRNFKAGTIHFYKTEIKNSVFDTVNLPEAKFDRTSMTSSQFKHSNLAGSKFTGVNAAGIQLKNVDLSRSSHRNTVFYGLNMQEVQFDHADIHGLYFVGIDADLDKVPHLNASNLKNQFSSGFVAEAGQSTQSGQPNSTHMLIKLLETKQKTEGIDEQTNRLSAVAENSKQNQLNPDYFRTIKNTSFTNARGTGRTNLVFLKLGLERVRFDSFLAKDYGEIRFSKAHLTNTRFKNMQLKAGLTFHKSTIAGSRFDNSNLNQIEVVLSNMRGASFNKTVMKRAGFKYSVIEKSSFRDAELLSTTFTNSFILGGDLRSKKIDVAGLTSRHIVKTKMFPETKATIGKTKPNVPFLPLKKQIRVMDFVQQIKGDLEGLTFDKKGELIRYRGELKSADDLIPLFRFSEIQVLNLQSEHSINLKGIEKFEKLKELELNLSVQEEISFTEKMPSLVKLTIDARKLKRINGFEHLPKLQQLRISRSKIDDISGILMLNQLKSLDFRSSTLKRIEGDYSGSNMETLEINANRLINYPGLKTLSHLKSINIRAKGPKWIRDVNDLK